MTFLVIGSGGTFDKRYDESSGAFTFGASHLPDILQRARITVPARLEQLPLMDSLDMVAQDRERIADACERAAETTIVIVHGTDTMQQTAEVVANRLGSAATGKTVVLTGAMIPYDIVGSDALFNFGHALAAAQLLPAGVYVAMNGQVFPWNDVVKNKTAGRFERR